MSIAHCSSKNPRIQGNFSQFNDPRYDMGEHLLEPVWFLISFTDFLVLSPD